LAALTGAALSFYAVPEYPVLANQSEALLDYKTITSPIVDAINQNTRGQSEGYAVGVPRNFAWCSGSYKPPGSAAPPFDFTAVTGWGQVYPKVGSPASWNPDGSILVGNAKTYVHLRATREWILVQDQATDSIAGAHFVADFAKETAEEMRVRALGDSSVALSVPTTGFNAHFWLTKRGTYVAGSIDGVYVQMDMRTDDPNVKLVANVGADWWRNSIAGFVRGYANNPVAGMSNWIELSTQWSTLRFYSESSSEFQAYPPPQLAGSTPETTPTIIRRRASTPAPCLYRPQDSRS
jgi:hypothetical protein